MNLEKAYRVGPASSSRPRTVMVHCERFVDRETVIRNTRKLKGTGEYIKEDLCGASQAIKQSNIPLMKQARLQGKAAYFKHTEVVIKDRMREYSSVSNELTGAASSETDDAPAGPGSTDAADVRAVLLPMQGQLQTPLTVLLILLTVVMDQKTRLYLPP